MAEYCTCEDVKGYLGITNDNSKDSILDDLIKAAQSFVEEYCNTVFDKAEVTEFHTGGSTKVLLKKYPVDTTKDFKLYDDWQRKYGSDTLIDPEDYFVDAEAGIVEADYPIGGWAGSVKVVYTGGFTNVPAAIKQACIELAARKMKEGSGNLGVPQRTIAAGVSAVFSPNDLLPQTKIALDQFRRIGSI